MQKWVLYACVILIINSIFHILTPNSSIKNMMSFVLNLFLIGLILTPIFKNISAPKLEEYFNSKSKNLNNEKQIEQNLLETNKKNLESALKILLKNNNIENCNIVLETNGNKQETKINIEIPSNKKNEEIRIKNLIKNQTGIVPKIILKTTN